MLGRLMGCSVGRRMRGWPFFNSSVCPARRTYSPQLGLHLLSQAYAFLVAACSFCLRVLRIHSGRCSARQLRVTRSSAATLALAIRGLWCTRKRPSKTRTSYLRYYRCVCDGSTSQSISNVAPHLHRIQPLPAPLLTGTRRRWDRKPRQRCDWRRDGGQRLVCFRGP